LTEYRYKMSVLTCIDMLPAAALGVAKQARLFSFGLVSGRGVDKAGMETTAASLGAEVSFI